MGCDVLAHGCVLDVATNCVSVHGTYIALEPSLDGEEPTAFNAVVLSLISHLSLFHLVNNVLNVIRFTANYFRNCLILD